MDSTGVTSGEGAGVKPIERWLALGTISTATLLVMTVWFSATAIGFDLAAEWDVDRSRASALTVCVQLGFVAGALVSAATGLGDRVPPGRLFLVGALGAAISNLALVVAPGLEIGLVLRFLTGAALALVYPMGVKLVVTWFQLGRGLALGVVIAALTVGSAMPHLLAALGGADWFAVILASSGLCVLGGLLVQFGVGEGPFPLPITRFSVRSAVRAVRDPGVVLASVGYFGHMWELYAMWASLGIFFEFVFADAERHVAPLATFVAVASGAIGCVLMGKVSDRWGRTMSASIAMGVSGACCIAIGLVIELPSWVIVAVACIWGITVIADSAQFSAATTEVADQSYVGTAVTLQLAGGFALSAATIGLVPLWVEQLSWQFAFAPLALGPLVGILAMILLRRTAGVQDSVSGRL